MKREVKIDGCSIGPGHPPYIVAELSANHNGSLEQALKIIDRAKECGADAVKIQTYSAETMTIDCQNEDFLIKGGLWDGYNLFQLYKWAETPYEWHQELFSHAAKKGITIFSTPFDESAVDLLEDLNTPAYKIASFEIIDLPLISYVAHTGKPMILSTGMATLDEIDEAVVIARESGCNEIILLHCISGYPAPVEQTNLHTIEDLARRFGVVSGLSDHTLGVAVATAGVALGASFIEKHFTQNRDDKGPDSEFSLVPEELKRLCRESREAWAALGKIDYDLKPAEIENLKFRRSIYIVKDIAEGEAFTAENIKRIRPGFGLEPKYFYQILGKACTQSLKRGTALRWEHVKK